MIGVARAENRVFDRALCGFSAFHQAAGNMEKPHPDQSLTLPLAPPIFSGQLLKVDAVDYSEVR
jgi:hypothetical protein